MKAVIKRGMRPPQNTWEEKRKKNDPRDYCDWKNQNEGSGPHKRKGGGSEAL